MSSKKKLLRFLESECEDYDERYSSKCSQCVSTDRIQVIKCMSTIDDFIDGLTNNIENLILQSYVANLNLHSLNWRKTVHQKVLH